MENTLIYVNAYNKYVESWKENNIPVMVYPDFKYYVQIAEQMLKCGCV